MNLSALLTSYNLAKHFGRRTGIIEPKRIDRALGILMSPGKLTEKETQYGSSPSNCGCADSRFRHPVVCKHSIASMIRADTETIMDNLRRGGA